MKERQAYPIGLLLALCLAESTVTFETSMIFAALPKLIRTFGDPFMAGQLVAIHPLVAASTAPVVGRLGDLWGRKPMILILLALALIGSVISAVSENFVMVLIGRAMQGLSVTVLSLGIGVLRENLDMQRLPMSIGFLTTAQGVGAASGLIFGGMIVDHFNWHWLFVASSLLIALAVLLSWLWLPNRKIVRGPIRIDWIEALLPMPAIACVMIAIGMTKNHGLLSPQVLLTAGAGVFFFALWGRRALRARNPFIDLRLFTIRNFAVSNAATVLLAAGTMQIVYILSAYIQSPLWTGVGLGMSATAAGLAKLPSHMVTVTAGPLVSWQANRFGHRAAVMTSCLVAVTGWLYAILLPGHLLEIILLLTVTSYGTTMVVTAVTNAIVDTVPEDRTSEAIGTMLVVRGFGLAVGAQLIAVSLSAFTIAAPDDGSLFPTAESYRLTMGWIAATTFVAMAIGMLLPRGRRVVHGAVAVPVE
ncbi:Major Facilitator Superfamily protein [Novosphingobium sp. CF614]|uniref:MFS transporter n=1 Tax=Novosphingobium sp. CF614 TaxID=1884364 RepID=UPI0008E18424|nr:MFS transporter [Novosphingobium sp. CF614]SFF90220.1 Major Facilitator Superfamily protein [Novosphingobium sp. CF614]